MVKWTINTRNGTIELPESNFLVLARIRWRHESDKEAILVLSHISDQARRQTTSFGFNAPEIQVAQYLDFLQDSTDDPSANMITVAVSVLLLSRIAQPQDYTSHQ